MTRRTQFKGNSRSRRRERLKAKALATTTLKTHLESVVKTILSKLIKNAKATKKANLFIHI